MESMFGLFFMMTIVLGVGGLIVNVWGVLHVAQQPEWAWPVAGVDRTLWLVLTIVSFFTCFLLSAYYLIAIRPKLDEVRLRGPGMAGWWQASDGRWYPPPQPGS